MTGRVDLVWVVLAIVATVVGIWLGVAGPEVSPILTEAPTRAAGLVGGPGR